MTSACCKNFTVNSVAFVTTAAAVAITIASAYATAIVVSDIVALFFGFLAITACAISYATVLAWIDKSSVNVASYFANVYKHSRLTITTMYELVAMQFVWRLVDHLFRRTCHSRFG